MTDQERELFQRFCRFLQDFDGSDPLDVFAKFAEHAGSPCPINMIDEDGLFARKLAALTELFAAERAECIRLRNEQSRLMRKVRNQRTTIDQIHDRLGAVQSSKKNKASQIARLNREYEMLSDELEKSKVECDSLREALRCRENESE